MMIISQILSFDRNLRVCNSLEFDQIKKKLQEWNTFNSAIFKTIFYLIFVLSFRRVTVLFDCKNNFDQIN